MSLPVPYEQTHLAHPKYRADIDGLRAVAVLSVVGFHAFPFWIQGGFIGVDIFFVISGFLISTIIFENLHRDSFSFVEFYGRRIRRIFPALIVVLTASLVFGWFVLLSDEYKQLGKHIAGGAGFIQNFLLWRESGYFDNAAETKPLLHLWTLAIEEQFYIVWPLVLWFAWKKRFNLLTIAIAVAIISFALNIGKVHSDAVAAFYSPQTRFWELMAGSILAYIRLYKQNTIDAWLSAVIFEKSSDASSATVNNIQSLLGAALIGAGILVIKKEFSFPGWWAVLPILGAVFIISAGPHAWINRKFLSRKILVWFGLISFPLYLWHWPLLSFARILENGTPSREIRIAAVLISIVLSWLTYRLIERPVRFGQHGRSKTITLVVLMVVVGYVGYNTYERDGLPFRFISKQSVTLESGMDGGAGIALNNDCGLQEDDKKFFASCKRDSRQAPIYALLGDSKAGALYEGLVRTSNEDGRWLFIGGTTKYNGRYYAPDVISKNKMYAMYQPVTEMAVKAIAENTNIEKVVWATATRVLFRLKEGLLIEDLPNSKNYDAALDGIINTMSPLIKAGKKVVIVIDNPTLPNPEDCLRRVTSIGFINGLLTKSNPRCQLQLDRHLELSAQYIKLLNQVEKIFPESIKIFDTTKYMCDVEKGVCLPSKNGRAMYSNSDHISDYAAGLIGADLNNFLQSY